jgi:hypothetical protein
MRKLVGKTIIAAKKIIICFRNLSGAYSQLQWCLLIEVGKYFVVLQFVAALQSEVALPGTFICKPP